MREKNRSFLSKSAAQRSRKKSRISPEKSRRRFDPLLCNGLMRLSRDFAIISILYIFRAACLAYLPSDVRPTVELGVNLIRKGIVNPFLIKLTPLRANISRPSALKMYKVEIVKRKQE
ncbi:MAG: hypothetical protein HW387_1104 [Parachlamydiales bacterium]|nr:hypothetical protein [Parachlamydiales bacterium]